MLNGPANPRPPMTLDQQADLLTYLWGQITEHDDGKCSLTVILPLDRAQVDDLYMTAARLRRMAPHEDDIKAVVMGR